MLKYRKIFYTFSIILTLLSVAALLLWGLKPGIDFKGGSLMEIEYLGTRPDTAVLREVIKPLNLGNVLFQPVDQKGLIVRLENISEERHQALLQAISPGQPVSETLIQKRFDSVGPIIGRELAQRSWMAIALVILMIIIFIAVAFRKVSRPVASWKYGITTVIALIHDVTIPSGIFAVLGHFKGVEIDSLFITALLTIMGFSVHDTIVVFDRTRENLKKGLRKSFEETVDFSLKQVVGRSIKTSVSIVLVLVALLIFGGDTTRYFTLALTIGMVFGTYSSIFIASSLLVTWHNFTQKNKLKKA